MHAEEFISIPKKIFISRNPIKKEIFDNPIYRQKATQLAILQKTNPNMKQKMKKKCKLQFLTLIDQEKNE